MFAVTYRHSEGMPLCVSWVKVFKNGPSKICGRQPLKVFKGYLPQILLGPFLNTLTLSQWLRIYFLHFMFPTIYWKLVNRAVGFENAILL